jgi:hypothetical protein
MGRRQEETKMAWLIGDFLDENSVNDAPRGKTATLVQDKAYRS